jgi:hypothetical protein
MAVALACSLGVPWAFLQTLAWTGMFLGNLTTRSVSAALQRTFDGEHPCALCKAINTSKKSEKKSDKLLPLKKLDGLTQTVAMVVCPRGLFSQAEAGGVMPETLAHAPPSPPPRPV